MEKKEYYFYVKAKAVPVSEEVYKAYWKITEHEKYLYRKDREHCVLPFKSKVNQQKRESYTSSNQREEG